MKVKDCMTKDVKLMSPNQSICDAAKVMAELNGEPVPRTDFSERRLEPGDRLELVRAVAGG